MPYDFTPDPKDPRFRDPESISQQVARTNWEEDPMNPVRIRKFARAFGRRPSLEDVVRNPDLSKNPEMELYRNSLRRHGSESAGKEAKTGGFDTLGRTESDSERLRQLKAAGFPDSRIRSDAESRGQARVRVRRASTGSVWGASAPGDVPLINGRKASKKVERLLTHPFGNTEDDGLDLVTKQFQDRNRKQQAYGESARKRWRTEGFQALRDAGWDPRDIEAVLPDITKHPSEWSDNKYVRKYGFKQPDPTEGEINWIKNNPLHPLLKPDVINRAIQRSGYNKEKGGVLMFVLRKKSAIRCRNKSIFTQCSTILRSKIKERVGCTLRPRG